MASVTSFQTRFPEFTDNEDDQIQLFLDDAALLMGSQARWLSFYDVAHEYYAAHLLAVSEHTETGDSGILAPAKRQEVDDVVIENAISPIEASFDDLFSTAYGKRYNQYRRICFAGVYGV